MTKPRAYFLATITAAEIIENPGKKPFIALSLEGDKDPQQQYPNRAKAVIYSTYPNDFGAEAPKFVKGARILVDGTVSAEAYLSNKTSKPVGVIKIFVNSYSFEGISSTAAASPTAKHEPVAKVQEQLPLSKANEDSEIPF